MISSSELADPEVLLLLSMFEALDAMIAVVGAL